MRPADARRTCKYHFPEDPQKVCSEILSGQGRSKWCPSHAELVRQAQKSLRNASHQQIWRDRHRSLSRRRRSIYQAVRRIERFLLKEFPEVQSRRLHRALLMSVRRALDETARPRDHILLRSAILPAGYRALIEMDSQDGLALLDSHPGDGPYIVRVTFEIVGLKDGFPHSLLPTPSLLLLHNYPEKFDICNMQTVDHDASKVPWFYRAVCKDCRKEFSGDLLSPWLLQLLCYSLALGWSGEGRAIVTRMPAVASALQAKDYLWCTYDDSDFPKSVRCVVKSSWPLSEGLDIDRRDTKLRCVDAEVSRLIGSRRLSHIRGDWLRFGLSLLEYDQMNLAALIWLKTSLRISEAGEYLTRDD